MIVCREMAECFSSIHFKSSCSKTSKGEWHPRICFEILLWSIRRWVWTWSLIWWSRRAFRSPFSFSEWSIFFIRQLLTNRSKMLQIGHIAKSGSFATLTVQSDSCGELLKPALVTPHWCNGGQSISLTIVLQSIKTWLLVEKMAKKYACSPR